MRKIAFNFFIVFVCLVAFLKADFVLASNGFIDSVKKYAWSDSVGWISFNTDGAGSPIVTDSEITGYAWNDNFGWINLSPDSGGVKNDGQGNLSGKAWGENTGWINFSGVVINSDGKFTGQATGDVVGTISFDCDNCNVETTWRAESHSSYQGPTAAENYELYSDSSLFGVYINSSAQITNSRNVVLSFKAPVGIISLEVSNYADFSQPQKYDSLSQISWTLAEGDGLKQVFARFSNGQGKFSNIISTSIILDTQAPSLSMVSDKNSWNSQENVILSGISESLAKILIFIDNKYYSEIWADSQGKWDLNLGVKNEGEHSLKIIPQDKAGNNGPETIFDFRVQQKIPDKQKEDSSLAEQIKEEISSVWQQITAQQPEKETLPQEVVTVPVEVPLVFSGINLLPQKKLEKFVFDDLPENIKIIAQKFPEIENTFEKVGISNVSGATRLMGVALKLPTLTQTAMGHPQLDTGKFTQEKAIPIGQLTSTAKLRIPSEIIFAKAGGGMVDFNSTMSLDAQGKVEQTVKTLAGQTMQFVVRAESQVKAIKGYLIFKSKKSDPAAFGVSARDLTASLLFDEPDLTSPEEIKKEMVVLEFDYEDAGDGVYVAQVPMPVVSGEYESVAVIDYQDSNIEQKRVSLVTVIDPEGYIYEESGKKQIRIPGAIVSIYWLNPGTSAYELWPAKDYQQTNPIITNETGNYSFLVPEGTYSIKVTAPGYMDYEGKPFEVKEGGGVHANIQLRGNYWWVSFLDWKSALMAIVILLFIYNFYRNKIRELYFKKQK